MGVTDNDLQGGLRQHVRPHPFHKATPQCHSSTPKGQTNLIYCFTDPAGQFFTKCNDKVKWVWP